MIIGHQLMQRSAGQHLSGSLARRLLGGCVIAALLALPPTAHASEPGRLGGGQTLEVALSFPDDGLNPTEQVCLGLYPDTVTDFTLPPLQARCLDPDEQSVMFEDISAGDFVIAVPGQGSRLLPERYQGQLVETSIPESTTISDYAIDVEIDLTPEIAGTRGRVEVNVFGCPEGTNGGEDATAWAGECEALADGIPLSLSGRGTIGDTALSAVTGETVNASGKVEFTNLPAGAYELGGKLPGNVASPAIFIQSSIEGGIRPISEGGGLALRPAENLSVRVYLVLGDPAEEDQKSELLAGFAEPAVTGGLTRAEAEEMQQRLNALP